MTEKYYGRYPGDVVKATAELAKIMVDNELYSVDVSIPTALDEPARPMKIRLKR